MNIFSKKEAMKFKDRNGSILAFVVIIFMVVTIIASTIIYIFNTNLKQVKSQQDFMESYYLAYSGAQAAYAALNENSAKLDVLINTPTSKEETKNKAYGNGILNVVARKSTNENFKEWIKITSTSTLNNSGRTHTRILYFDPGDPSKIVWGNE